MRIGEMNWEVLQLLADPVQFFGVAIQLWWISGTKWEDRFNRVVPMY
ncbi:hypothetical protein ACLM5H_12105 [Fredinandcohnia humi]